MFISAGMYEDYCNRVVDTLKFEFAKGGKAVSKFEKLPKNRQADKNYDYFAVGISDGKIVDGWEIVDDVESLKFYAKQDLRDNDYNPKDFRILSKEHIIRGGINPFDFDNWRKTRTFKTGGEIKEGGTAGDKSKSKVYLDFERFREINECSVKNEVDEKYYVANPHNVFDFVCEDTQNVSSWYMNEDVLRPVDKDSWNVIYGKTNSFKEGGTAGDTNDHGNIDGNKANPEDFVLIKTESSHTGDTVIFVVRKSELAKIPDFKNIKDVTKKTIEMQADQFLAMHDVTTDNRYDLIEVETDPRKVKEYLKGYNHTDYRIKLTDNTEDFHFGFVVYANRGKLKDSFSEGGGVSDFLEEHPSEFAKGGTVEENLIKELHKLQRELNSSRLNTYIEGDNSEEEISRQAERKIKLDRFYEVLALLNDKKQS
jgi:hypothetical protein